MAKEVTKSTGNGLAVAEFEDLAGLGFEEAKSEDMAIPFLRILAQLSPQVNKRDGAYVEGAEAGMIYNTVSNEVFKGEDGITVIPCYYSRRYVEWKPRAEGGGYVNSYHPDDTVVTSTVRNERGEDVLPNGNLLTNTAQFFVILETPTQDNLSYQYQRCLITMSSTQLKKARRWVTQMNSLTAINSKGSSYTLPMMSHRYILTTVQEQNDKGNWFGWDVAKSDTLELGKEWDKSLFHEAVAFAKSCKAGEVKVKEQEGQPEEMQNVTSTDSPM